MRHNNRQKTSNILDRYDRVYIHIPQCPWLRSMVAEPFKTIFYNTAADPGANVDRMFRGIDSMHDLERFCMIYNISLL